RRTASHRDRRRRTVPFRTVMAAQHPCPRPFARQAALFGAVLAGACAPAATTTPSGPNALPSTMRGALPPGPLDVNRPLTAREQQWVEQSLASLSLRDRVAQLV